ncbi:TetR/AcrR family transcriptional regulator [Enterovirga sp. CN4-39]|uniref:TetR/AcrR family transcriptional regulator n=1 Tax=Enterovirga sp. CN4-39 TaxID=3400910 RepID=UPI003C0368CC
MRPETLERRRGKVLAAAARLFATEEYGRVHMDDVALAADIAKPTLYRYFSTKEALFMAALEQTLQDLRADAAAIRAERGPAEARLRKTVALVHDQVGALAPALRAIEGEGSGPGETSRKALRKGMRDIRDELANLIREGVELGEFEVADCELAAIAIVGAIRMTAIVGNGTAGSARRLSDLLLGGLARRTTLSQPAPRLNGVLVLGDAS